jgi:glutaminyl-tRNA synthetase
MSEASSPQHFIRKIIVDDLQAGRVEELVTRFPPEPNGYLHIGHAKSIWLNFGLAREFGGRCNLRFDDTNPEKEEQEYVQSIIEDVRWLGFDWDGEVRFASDYFGTFFEWAVYLVQTGKAYVCEQSAEEMRLARGTLTEPGSNSPWRERPVEENFELLQAMRRGDVEEGRMTLRAKIDMASPNLNMRDPVLYRVKRQSHHRTGRDWSIYPSYDFAHGQEDAIEGVTHSICTLEFEDHRPLYEWFLDNLPVPSRPRQYEFARLNVNYTITSKRRLKQLVDEGIVDGWDDPRMPTLSGLRRRGVPPEALLDFCERTGVTKADGVVDMSLLEFCIRDCLDKTAPRAMCVLRPLKLTISNYPEGGPEELSAPRHPNRPEDGERALPFSGTLYIDREDFRVEANKHYKRLVLGKSVRLRNAYVVTAEDYRTDEAGNVVEVICRYDPDTLGRNPDDGSKPRGVIHWVSAEHSVSCEVRVYDRLFDDPAPTAGDKNFLEHVNGASLEVLPGCRAERSLADAPVGRTFQFEREGYYCRDSRSGEDTLVFNRTISLRDGWGKAEAG